MYIHIYIHTRICRLCVLYLPVPVPLPLLLFSFCFFPSLSLSLSILLFDTEGTMGVIHFFTYTERYKPAVLFQRWPVSKGHFAVHPHESARSGAGGKELLHLFMMSAQQTYSVRSVDFQFSKLGNTNMRPPRMCGEMCGGWLCTWMLPSLYTWWQHSWLHVGNTNGRKTLALDFWLEPGCVGARPTLTTTSNGPVPGAQESQVISSKVLRMAETFSFVICPRKHRRTSHWWTNTDKWC